MHQSSGCKAQQAITSRGPPRQGWVRSEAAHCSRSKLDVVKVVEDLAGEVYSVCMFVRQRTHYAATQLRS